MLAVGETPGIVIAKFKAYGNVYGASGLPNMPWVRSALLVPLTSDVTWIIERPTLFMWMAVNTLTENLPAP